VRLSADLPAALSLERSLVPTNYISRASTLGDSLQIPNVLYKFFDGPCISLGDMLSGSGRRHSGYIQAGCEGVATRHRAG
jgi:hypothetical protein